MLELFVHGVHLAGAKPDSHGRESVRHQDVLLAWHKLLVMKVLDLFCKWRHKEKPKIVLIELVEYFIWIWHWLLNIYYWQIIQDLYFLTPDIVFDISPPWLCWIDIIRPSLLLMDWNHPTLTFWQIAALGFLRDLTMAAVSTKEMFRHNPNWPSYLPTNQPTQKPPNQQNPKTHQTTSLWIQHHLFAMLALDGTVKVVDD